MSSYETLAAYYDELTEDVEYRRRADFVERLMGRSRVPVKTVLDLACGTGTMTGLFTQRGYELIAVDGSEDMLAQAREKAAGLPGEPPIFLHQDMPRLDLYGTVEAAMCCLDSLNYLTDPKDVQRTFQRLRLFIQPGGVLVFDVNTPHKLQGLDGQVFWTSGRMCTVCGAQNTLSAAESAATTWISSPPGPTGPGSGILSATASGPTPWRS